jgi:hypothetical protein
MPANVFAALLILIWLGAIWRKHVEGNPLKGTLAAGLIAIAAYAGALVLGQFYEMAGVFLIVGEAGLFVALIMEMTHIEPSPHA